MIHLLLQCHISTEMTHIIRFQSHERPLYGAHEEDIRGCKMTSEYIENLYCNARKESRRRDALDKHTGGVGQQGHQSTCCQESQYSPDHFRESRMTLKIVYADFFHVSERRMVSLRAVSRSFSSFLSMQYAHDTLGISIQKQCQFVQTSEASFCKNRK